VRRQQLRDGGADSVGGQRFGGFSGGNARELMNLCRRRVAFLGRPEYS